MVRKILILILISSYSSLAYTQIKLDLIQNDLASESLKGKVKSITSKTYRVSHNSDSTYVLTDDNITTWGGSIVNFNLDGYKECRLAFDLKKEKPLDSLKWIYKYDDKHRVVQELWINYGTPIDTNITYYEFKDDSIVLRQNEIASSKHKITSNQEIITSTSKNGYKTKRLYQFDNHDRLIRYEDYEDKEFIQELHIYTYRDTLSKNIFKQINIYPKHYNDANYITKEYDSFGNPVDIKYQSFQNDKIRVNKIEYKYDSKGNWIERRYFYSDGKLSKISFRTIIYY